MSIDLKTRFAGNSEIIEKVIHEFYKGYLKSDSNAIDGGAHLSYHTWRLATCAPQGKVIGVEANYPIFQELQLRCAKFPNIFLEFSALYKTNGVVLFNSSDNHPGRSGIDKVWDKIDKSVQYNTPVAVEAVTIDSLVYRYNLESLDFIKLDLEGGEIPALMGAKNTLLSMRPAIVIEYSLQALEIHNLSVEEFLNFLGEYEYTAYAPDGTQVTKDNGWPFWYIFLFPNEKSEICLSLLDIALSTQA